jgi:hypothetical protein
MRFKNGLAWLPICQGERFTLSCPQEYMDEHLNVCSLSLFHKQLCISVNIDSIRHIVPHLSLSLYVCIYLSISLSRQMLKNICVFW